MHDPLFLQLEEWHLSREKIDEFTDLLERLTVLPHVTLDLIEIFTREIRREVELWQKLNPHFENREEAFAAYIKEYYEKNKE